MERIDGFECDKKIGYWFLIDIYTEGKYEHPGSNSRKNLTTPK